MAVGDGSAEPGDEEPKTQAQDVPKDLSQDGASMTSTQISDKKNGEDTKHIDENESEDNDEVEEEDDDEEEEEEEPRLKYATLTKNLGSLYKNGDATSCCLVAGDKMIIGTHNGNIHVFALPSLRSLKYYKAHQTTVTSISISPMLSSLVISRPDAMQRLAPIPAEEPSTSPQNSPNSKRTPQQSTVPRTPSNDIYIASSSMDGYVCIASLIDPSDVQKRNFSRPIQAIALSPDYKSDKSYLTGGQAGALNLTIGGQKGRVSNATTTSAAAAASGWLGQIGIGANTGTEKLLHSGEGVISAIKWSPSGKYVIWANEYGVKIARTNLHLSNAEQGLEWKPISHIDRPEADEALGVWKPRIEWIDRSNLESDDDSGMNLTTATNGSTRTESQPEQNKKVEEVFVAWGDEIWLCRVLHSKGKTGTGSHTAGSVERPSHPLKLGDCVISGISLYTQKLLLVLAYTEKKVKDKPSKSSDTPRRGRMHRQNGLKPELRIIDMNTSEEVESDMLHVSRFETLLSSDYHLAVLPPVKIPAQLAQRGYLNAIGSGVSTVGSGLYTGVETVGQGVWDATMYGPRRLGVNRLFSSSGDSIRSGKVGAEPAPSIRERNYLAGWIPGFGSSVFSKDDEHLSAIAVSQGMKIFIYSPYDTVVAIRRNISDRLQWLLEKSRYQQAWELVDEHPEAVGPKAADDTEVASPSTPSKSSSITKSSSIVSQQAAQPPPPQQNTLAEFFADAISISSSQQQSKDKYSSAEKEKRRIGELWLHKLIADKQWAEAGEVAEKVLNTTTPWNNWVWRFLRHKKFDEIAFHIPTFQITPPLESQVFEIVLGHYVSKDRRKFKQLLDLWPSDLFDIGSITTVILDQIKADNVRKGSDDWCILQECLAKLYLADGHYKEAMKCYMLLQDADTAMTLMKEHHLVDAIEDDIPSFVLLRISPSQVKTSSEAELEELSSDSIKVLVDETNYGVVIIDDVVNQLQAASLNVFLFFYLRALWHGKGNQQHGAQIPTRGRARTTDLADDEGKAQVETYADTAIELFAEHDRDSLMNFLHTSNSYTYEKALKVCERHGFIEEQVYLLSKTGSMKKALFLIIDKLSDVSKAIAFAKDQDDKGLWDDFLDYSMSRPKFISGLLAEVGTAIDPIELLKRIPSGLEIEGLKEGLIKMLREYDIQDSISNGAAQVLSSEVAVGMGILRAGRSQGIKFDVPKAPKLKRSDTVTPANINQEVEEPPEHDISPGHCAACGQAFTPHETVTLIGFACGHVYHAQHLFHEPGKDENEHELSLPKLNKDDDNEDGNYTSGFTRAVDPKVTNARLLKDKVEEVGGCKICKAHKDKVPDT